MRRNGGTPALTSQRPADAMSADGGTFRTWPIRLRVVMVAWGASDRRGPGSSLIGPSQPTMTCRFKSPAADVRRPRIISEAEENDEYTGGKFRAC